MDEMWLATATIEQLMDVFRNHCRIILEHEICKESHDTEDMLRIEDPSYMSNKKVAESAQKDLDLIKAEIIQRANEKRFSNDFREASDGLRRVLGKMAKLGD